MKTQFIALGAAIGLLGVFASSPVQAQCVVGSDGDQFKCFDLLAGQTIPAGSVCVEVNEENLVVSYNTTDGWTLDEVHLWVGSSLASLPKNKSGNPVPGSFPYKSGSLGDGVTSYVIEVSLADLGFTCPGDDKEFHLAAHAAVRKQLDDGSYQTETGWSEGPRIKVKGNWATYSSFTLSCDCEEIVDPPTECWDDETAWAAGTRYVDRGNWATYTAYDGTAKVVTLFAGQTHVAGTVSFSAPDNVSGDVTICVTLNPGFRFAAVDENVKVQGYDSAPSGNPNPGGFTTHKGTAAASPYCFTVGESAFYGVHVDVERKVECPPVEPQP